MMPVFRSSVVCSAALLLAACGASDEPPAAAVEQAAIVDTTTFSADAVAIAGFSVDTAHYAMWQSSVVVPGRLMLDPQALETIGSITEGRITHVLVRVGDRVRAGQVLVMIHSHEIMDARSALSHATSALAAAEAERDLAAGAAARARRLFDARAMAQADVERADVARRVAVATYEQAVAERDRARALVDHLVGTGPVPPGADDHDVLIRTPIAGVVTARAVQPGTVVLPGTPLVTVGSPDKLQLQVHLTEAAATGVRQGSLIRYALTENPGERADAIVTRVAPTVDTLTRTIEVIAQPRGVVLGRAESFVQAEVQGRGISKALIVPAAAVQAMEGDTVVFTAQPRGAGLFVKAVPVRIARRSTEQLEIAAGVTAGVPVIVRGAAIAKAELLKRRTSGE
jgi:cobalt-zinc-cadmium efflux system membrane fusion protein